MAMFKNKKDGTVNNNSPVPEMQQQQSTTEKSNYVDLVLGVDKAIRISVGNAQDQGARPYQEDSFGYSNIIDSNAVTTRGLVAVLSDGMGGLSDGKAVSEGVISGVISRLPAVRTERNIGAQLADIILNINDYTCNQYIKGNRSTAGATAVILYIYKNRLFWATVGDSRLYCIRNNMIYQVNEDHDYMNTLLRKSISGECTVQEARTDPQRASLTSFVGKQGLELIDYSVYGFRIMPGDIFILCSDGVYNGISKERMMDIAIENDAQTASECMVREVLAANIQGQDNLTAMVIRCEKR